MYKPSWSGACWAEHTARFLLNQISAKYPSTSRLPAFCDSLIKSLASGTLAVLCIASCQFACTLGYQNWPTRAAMAFARLLRNESCGDRVMEPRNTMALTLLSSVGTE